MDRDYAPHSAKHRERDWHSAPRTVSTSTRFADMLVWIAADRQNLQVLHGNQVAVTMPLNSGRGLQWGGRRIRARGNVDRQKYLYFGMP